MSYFLVWLLKILPCFGHWNAKNLVQEFVQKIIGNAMTCAFQLAKNVMESVCKSLPLNAMALVFQSTSPVTTIVTMTVKSIVMGNVFILRRKKKRLSKVDVKVRYRV
jgi:hypothetical protein